VIDISVVCPGWKDGYVQEFQPIDADYIEMTIAAETGRERSGLPFGSGIGKHCLRIRAWWVLRRYQTCANRPGLKPLVRRGLANTRKQGARGRDLRFHRGPKSRERLAARSFLRFKPP